MTLTESRAGRFDTPNPCGHNDYMPDPHAVGAREFKTRLGTYLRQVREGRTVTITDRGRPVARVMPVDMSGQSIVARLERLRAEGVVTGTGGSLPRVAAAITGRGGLFSETLAHDREDRF